MKLTFWGAARTVTGSMHQITTENEIHLLDCGLRQGRRRESFEINHNLPVAAPSVHSVILSHAHLDHSGNLPTLARDGFSGPIHATPATTDLCRYMLADSAFLQEKDAAFIEQRRRRRKAIGLNEQEPPVPPLYSMADAEATMQQFTSHPLYQTKEVGTGLSIRYGNAGHILGSAFVLLEQTQKGHTRRLLFSGDLGRRGLPILRDPDPAPEADYLILESTYGNGLHQPLQHTEGKLARLIAATAERGGRVIVPAFAVGRTQQLVLLLHQLVEKKRIPDIPIFVDSPLAINVTEVFRKHPDEYDEEAVKFVNDGKDPFGFYRLRYVREASESKTLNDLRMPFVVISASGMCEGGRILHHLRNGIEDSRNLVLITGFQAEHTLGRRLVERAPEVKIFGQLMKLRAEVAVLNELSGHADQRDLVAWVRPIAQKLKGIFLVHGEEQAQSILASVLREEFQVPVHIPVRGQSFDLA